MHAANPPVDYLARLRAHEAAAVEQLVHAYEPVLLRFLAHRIRGLDAALEPADVAQETFAQFFAKLGTEFNSAASQEELAKILFTIGRELIIDQWRHARSQRRGGHQPHTGQAHLERIIWPGPAPSHDLIEQAQIQQIQEQMSKDEWRLATAWASGKKWGQIAAEGGQTAESLRKKFARTITRVRRDLNPERDTRLRHYPKRTRRNQMSGHSCKRLRSHRGPLALRVGAPSAKALHRLLACLLPIHPHSKMC
jgi:DNA-directed RNA polymerase specialized sigma24 family protein